ncbi:MAG TPA: heavy metal-binding domain-containing protein, partial [Planctomycetaceae bacterium]
MSREHAAHTAPRAGTVIDPVCGMTVDPARAAGSHEHGGETYYFCSKSCARKFAADPEKYLRGDASQDHSCCGSGPQVVPLGKPSRTDAAPPKGSCCHGGAAAPAETATRTASGAGKYVCPMCPGVESDVPAACPKCGMALEPAAPARPSRKTIYTCPMHPEVEQDTPGNCPICGMALEPKSVVADVPEDDSELRDMTRRFWVAAALSVPVLLLAMGPMIGLPLHDRLGPNVARWLELLL